MEVIFLAHIARLICGLFFLGCIQIALPSCTLELKNPKAAIERSICQPLKGKKILLLYTSDGVKGGTRSYKVSLYQYLIKDGFDPVFFLVNNPEMQEELDELKLPYYLCKIKGKRLRARDNREILACIDRVCAIEPIGIINANREREVVWGKLLARKHHVKVVLTLHVDNLQTKDFLQGLDGVLGVSPQIAQLVAEQNEIKRLGIKVINWSAPFFNSKSFLEYEPKETKEAFFCKNFGITLTSAPVVCMVGNFLSAAWKDHPTLLNAMKILVQDRGLAVQLLLAGDGPLLEEMRNMAKTLGLENHVFFLGYTRKIADIVHFSDIKVVASKNESFCIALLEAALLRKPLIGTRGTGMGNIIKDGETGLLFAKGNAKDLADKIEFFLKDKSARNFFGAQAYNYVTENFLPEISIKKIENFYCEVLHL